MLEPRRDPIRSLWREFDEMMADMDTRFREMLEGFGSERSLPAFGLRRRMLPAYQSELTVDVKEHEENVTVVADMPGASKEEITITLLDPRTLYICAKREEARGEKEEGYFLQERVRGRRERTITLPADVTDDGARATFNNGVLELRLPKKEISSEKRIPVE